MIYINEVPWRLKFVPHNSMYLTRSDGSVAIGMTDCSTLVIYLDETLRGQRLKKVLCHELVHAAMFSYHIDLEIQQEEVIADIIATYGEEILSITNKVFKKLKNKGEG